MNQGLCFKTLVSLLEKNKGTFRSGAVLWDFPFFDSVQSVSLSRGFSLSYAAFSRANAAAAVKVLD
jgi:hypothetical protein